MIIYPVSHDRKTLKFQVLGPLREALRLATKAAWKIEKQHWPLCLMLQTCPFNCVSAHKHTDRTHPTQAVAVAVGSVFFLGGGETAAVHLLCREVR